MKRFKFKLQTVHDLRESRLEAAEKELAGAKNEVYRAEVLLQEISRVKQRALENYLMLYQSREIEVTMISAHSDFIASLMRREQDARAYLGETERRLAIRRDAVTEAMRDTEATAKLRDKQHQRHNHEANRQQQNNLDEMAVLAVARRRMDPQ